MSEDVLRTELESRLSQLDWRAGISKAALIDHLAADPPARQAITRGLVDGVYFSPADVLTSLPAAAWQEPPPAPEPPFTASPLGEQRLPEPLNHIPIPVAVGVVGGAALVGFVAGLGWLLRRRREP